MNKKLFYSEDSISLGLLVLRIGIGIAFVVHGYPKVFGGTAVYLAAALTKAGIPGGIFGAYLSGLAEMVGGLVLIVGVLSRPATLILAFDMLVALSFHFTRNDNFQTYSHALESLVVFIALTITGPGKFSLDHRLFALGEKKSHGHHGYHGHMHSPSSAPV